MADPTQTAAPASGRDEPHAYGAERGCGLDEEDASTSDHLRSWAILAVMILASLGYHFLIFWLQPGLG